MLSVSDFETFFTAIHGYEPFPWQKRLLQQLAGDGEWPDVLDLPTGSGKTAAIDVAVFHLALDADRGPQRRAPVRIAFVVDRRIVVDDAFARARKLASALADPKAGSVVAHVAERLKYLSDDGPPLIARRLRGGVPRETDWTRTPVQPTVLCSTVDQIGSRLLFRGYGVTNSMKPIHAGLLGSDCLILLDEAHLAEPFRQTLAWIQIYRGENWRETPAHTVPKGIALLTATPDEHAPNAFLLGNADRAHPILKARLEACKPAFLTMLDRSRVKRGNLAEAEPGADEPVIDNELAGRVSGIVKAVGDALAHFRKSENGVSNSAVGVVMNRVPRARQVFDRLREDYKDEIASEELSVILMIGPARPVDRDDLVKALDPIRTQAYKEQQARALERPLVLVATQCIEAGVDIDLDALVTEVAPLDVLRQRFGRLNRAGRTIVPYAAIIAGKLDISARYDDPIYRKAIKPTWDYLLRASKADDRKIDFGISAIQALMEELPPPVEALMPKMNAPIFLPAHLDLLSQTSPIPAADPDIALFLHGPNRQPDSISVVWRADIDPNVHLSESIRRLLTLVPPRSTEAVPLPIWVVRRWLAEDEEALEGLADIAGDEPEGETRIRAGRPVFRWRGDTEESVWIVPSRLRPGDVIVVPTRYGGLDGYGWKPSSRDPIRDVAQEAAAPFACRRFAVRVAPGLLLERRSGETHDERANREHDRAELLADTLAAVRSAHWLHVRDALLSLHLPEDLNIDLRRLDCAKNESVVFDLGLYGEKDGRPRGVILVAPLGLKAETLREIQPEDAQPNATEDDIAGSMPGFSQSLSEHSVQVEERVSSFAEAAGLPPTRVKDLRLAGFLHDAGKADPRFQAWLQYDDPLGCTADEGAVLAKSRRVLPKCAREISGLPSNWRHEAFSVRLALVHNRFEEASDPELVLWLVGVHHGHGRPFFPHADPADDIVRTLPSTLDLPRELPAGHGPQSLAFNYEGLDWSFLFRRLKARYGVWELARMEAFLRLADHRASEDSAKVAPA